MGVGSGVSVGKGLTVSGVTFVGVGVTVGDDVGDGDMVGMVVGDEVGVLVGVDVGDIWVAGSGVALSEFWLISTAVIGFSV